VRSVPVVPGPNQVITESILNFVDLAGSEKIDIHDAILKKRGTSVSQANGSTQINTQFKDRTNESKHINKSLFFLT
jgi:centromeric protein E